MAQAKTVQRPRMSKAAMDKLGLKTIEEIREEAAAVETAAPLEVDRPGVIAGAAAAWMGMTFLLCYVLLPLTRQALGLRYTLTPSLFEEALMLAGSLGAFAVTLGVTVGGIAIKRPTISLDQGRREPILAATLGGLVPWAVLHNTLPFLIHFDEMSAASLLSFLGVNVLESALFGAMLASFTRSPEKAFALGAGFQLLFMTLGAFLTQIALMMGFGIL